MVQALNVDSSNGDLRKYASILLDQGVNTAIVKLGANGVAVATNNYFTQYPPLPPSKIISVTGAGDSLVGGFVYGILSGVSLDGAIKYGLVCAKLALESDWAVSQVLDPSKLKDS